MKLLCNEEKLFYTKIEWLNFKITTLPLAKLEMVGLRLVSDDLIFSDDIKSKISYFIAIHICELYIGAKTKKFS